jgi:Raf kinase inhibitor-like YbhB/YbcL family protein
MKAIIAGLVMLAAAGVAQADIKTIHVLDVQVQGIGADGAIDPAYAFCAPAAEGAPGWGSNISPQITWAAGPEATKSYVIIMVDPDVPTVFDEVNKEGKTIAANLPRQPFYHWVLVDVASELNTLPEGADSVELTKGGKPAGRAPYGIRGLNDYTKFMASNPDMKGNYAGYDGPCPPWNDERIHRYQFQVYALDIPSLEMPEGFTGPDVLTALRGHILAKGEAVGTYTLNKALAK